MSSQRIAASSSSAAAGVTPTTSAAITDTVAAPDAARIGRVRGLSGRVAARVSRAESQHLTQSDPAGPSSRRRVPVLRHARSDLLDDDVEQAASNNISRAPTSSVGAATGSKKHRRGPSDATNILSLGRAGTKRSKPNEHGNRVAAAVVPSGGEDLSESSVGSPLSSSPPVSDGEDASDAPTSRRRTAASQPADDSVSSPLSLPHSEHEDDAGEHTDIDDEHLRLPVLPQESASQTLASSVIASSSLSQLPSDANASHISTSRPSRARVLNPQDNDLFHRHEAEMKLFALTENPFPSADQVAAALRRLLPPSQQPSIALVRAFEEYIRTMRSKMSSIAHDNVVELYSLPKDIAGQKKMAETLLANRWHRDPKDHEALRTHFTAPQIPGLLIKCFYKTQAGYGIRHCPTLSEEANGVTITLATILLRHNLAKKAGHKLVRKGRQSALAEWYAQMHEHWRVRGSVMHEALIRRVRKPLRAARRTFEVETENFAGMAIEAATEEELDALRALDT